MKNQYNFSFLESKTDISDKGNEFKNIYVSLVILSLSLNHMVHLKGVKNVHNVQCNGLHHILLVSTDELILDFIHSI